MFCDIFFELMIFRKCEKHTSQKSKRCAIQRMGLWASEERFWTKECRNSLNVGFANLVDLISVMVSFLNLTKWYIYKLKGWLMAESLYLLLFPAKPTPVIIAPSLFPFCNPYLKRQSINCPNMFQWCTYSERYFIFSWTQ